MNNVIPMPSKGAGVGHTKHVQFDGRYLAWIPLDELRLQVWEWDQSNSADPGLFRVIVMAIACDLFKPMTDAEAKTYGWASFEVMRQRGRDMLAILQEPAPITRPLFRVV